MSEKRLKIEQDLDKSVDANLAIIIVHWNESSRVFIKNKTQGKGIVIFLVARKIQMVQTCKSERKSVEHRWKTMN